MPVVPNKPKRNTRMLIALLIGVVLVIGVSLVVGFSAIQKQKEGYSNATSTAVAKVVKATAEARVNPYSALMPSLNGIFFTTQQDATKWDNNETCTYKQGYMISSANGSLAICKYKGDVLTDYTVEADINLNTSKAESGIELRQNANKIVMLFISKEKISLIAYEFNTQKMLLSKSSSVSVGTKSDVLIGVVANHGAITVFANHVQALTVDDNACDIGSSTSFSITADTSDSTTTPSAVVYKSLKLWTV